MPKTSISNQNTYLVSITLPTTPAHSVKFTINNDKVNALSSSRMVLSVLFKALNSWIATNSAALTTNGDVQLITWNTKRLKRGEEIVNDSLSWKLSDKSCTFVAATVTTALTTTQLTVIPPFKCARS